MNYEEIIYENIRIKIRQLVYEIMDENWLPQECFKNPNLYIENLISYLMVVYDFLNNLSQSYIVNN